MSVKQFKRLGSTNLMWRVYDSSPAHITAEFLVPFEHPYKVGRWYDDIKYLGSTITRDRKWVHVVYISTKQLYKDNTTEIINRIISLVNYEH